MLKVWCCFERENKNPCGCNPCCQEVETCDVDLASVAFISVKVTMWRLRRRRSNLSRGSAFVIMSASCDVFCFCGWLCSALLCFGTPSYKTRSKLKHIPWSGAARINVTTVISITEAMELRSGWGTLIHKTQIWSSFEIAQNPFHSGPVHLSGSRVFELVVERRMKVVTAEKIHW